jgi:hypothetical protein
MVLSYISRVLMEDGAEDKILCGNSDHSALLQVQEPFAQILFSPSISENSDNTTNKCNMERAMNLLQGRNGNQCTLSSAFSKGEDAGGAFLKSIEEASRFLPRDNGIRKDQLVKQECSNHRASKAMMMMEELEDMFDKMMLRGYETCVKDMEKLRSAKADEAMRAIRRVVAR